MAKTDIFIRSNRKSKQNRAQEKKKNKKTQIFAEVPQKSSCSFGGENVPSEEPEKLAKP